MIKTFLFFFFTLSPFLNKVRRGRHRFQGEQERVINTEVVTGASREGSESTVTRRRNQKSHRPSARSDRRSGSACNRSSDRFEGRVLHNCPWTHRCVQTASVLLYEGSAPGRCLSNECQERNSDAEKARAAGAQQTRFDSLLRLKKGGGNFGSRRNRVIILRPARCEMRLELTKWGR